MEESLICLKGTDDKPTVGDKGEVRVSVIGDMRFSVANQKDRTAKTFKDVYYGLLDYHVGSSAQGSSVAREENICLQLMNSGFYKSDYVASKTGGTSMSFG